MPRNVTPEFAGRAHTSTGLFLGYVLSVSQYRTNSTGTKWALCLIQGLGERFEMWVEQSRITVAS